LVSLFGLASWVVLLGCPFVAIIGHRKFTHAVLS